MAQDQKAVVVMDQRAKKVATAMLQINGLGVTSHPALPVAGETAFLILPAGQEGHHYREDEGIATWRTLCALRLVSSSHLMIAGVSEEKISVARLARLAGIPGDRLCMASHARNTPDQMAWALAVLANKPEVKRLVVCTAAYHTPRCFLTMLRTMDKRGVELILYTAPLLSPDNPEVDQVGFVSTGSTGLRGEIERIIGYTDDVATLDRFYEYLRWWKAELNRRLLAAR